MSNLVVQATEPSVSDGDEGGRRGISRSHGALIAVACAYAAVVFFRTSQSMALTWDEVVYASEVVPEVPAVDFDAARSRGMPLLLAPVALLTPSIIAIRIYLTLLAGTLMYVAFRPWLSVVGHRNKLYSYTPAVAAALFATLWTTILYGTMAYPNIWLAFTLTAAVGGFCLTIQRPNPRIGLLLATGAAFAAATLLRPVDTTAAALALLGAALIATKRRWYTAIIPPIVGLASGWLAWTTEAQIRFGSIIERFRLASAMNEGGITWSLMKHVYSLDGPYLLCRPSELCDGAPLTSILWLITLPAFVAVGLFVARNHRRELLLASTSALGLAVPYVVLFDYANPRFLMPAYSLLMLPAAFAIIWVSARKHNWAKTVAVALVVAAVAAHSYIQQGLLEDAHAHVSRIGNNHMTQALYLRDAHGVGRPCLFVGLGSIQQSYILQCQSRYADGTTIPNEGARIREALSEGFDVVVRLNAADSVPQFMSSWRRVSLPGTSNYVVYLSPN